MAIKQELKALELKIDQVHVELVAKIQEVNYGLKEVKLDMQKIEHRITVKLGALITFLMLTLPAVSKKFFG